MKAVFLADAHLKNAHDRGYRDLMQFLDILSEVDGLFIAGDFFDFWFCRGGRVYPEFAPIIEKLVKLKQRGIAVTFCEGNHDFFMGNFFGDRLGMTVYSECADINLGDGAVLISHGDTIDRTNRKYLFLRKVLRSTPFFQFQKIIPLPVLWALARLSSMASKELSAEMEDSIAAKMEIFSQEKFKEGYNAVILGHCHKPLIKEFIMDGRKRTFVTLGDWIKYHTYLCYDNGRFMLKEFPNTITS